MIYYIADTHFGHSNIIHLCDRPFETVEEMDRVMIENWNSRVRTIDNLIEINDGQHMSTLCHYPMLSWRKQKKNYMIYGHIHNDTTQDYWPLIMERELMLNAGVEINNYMPVTFDELKDNNDAFREEHGKPS